MPKTYHLDKRVLVGGNNSVTNLQGYINIREYIEAVAAASTDESSETGITALAGGGQPSAAQTSAHITTSYAEVTIVQADGDSVLLPVDAVVGTKMTVKNDGANYLAVYPGLADTINNDSPNAHINIPAGGELTFRVTTVTSGVSNWETMEALGFQNGTVADPSITFENDPDTGLYRVSGGVTGISSNGNMVMKFGTTTNTIGDDITLFLNYPSLVTGSGCSISSSATGITGIGRLFQVDHTGTTSTSGVLTEISSAATDETTIFRVTASAALAAGVALDISGTAITTGTALDMSGLDALTTGRGLNIVSDSADTGTRALAQITNDNTAATGTTCLSLQNDSTGDALMITSGHFTMSEGVVAITNTANRKTLNLTTSATSQTGMVIVADSITSANGLAISMDAVTSGNILQLNANSSTMLSTGAYIACNDLFGTVFSVGNGGQVISKEATEIVTGTNSINRFESGTTYFLNSATDFVTTLPPPEAGINYKFIVTTAATTTAHTIVTQTGDDIIYGAVATTDGLASVLAAGADTISLTKTATGGIVGDMIELTCDGTNWYVRGLVSVAAGITFTSVI
jgi:hypothetical protein